MEWQPIETAPKDGTYVLLGNADGVWIGVFKSPFQSGFQPGNPWFSLMLNHRHMEKRNRNWSSVPTHWMPLPAVPKVGAGETAKKCDHKTRECTWQCKDCGERWGVGIAQ